jgi:peptidoglycan-N-acetylglucosamine deacetylase
VLVGAILLGAAGYLVGSVNFSIIVFRLLGRGDPRTGFSGNAGAFNASRQLGKAWGAAILLLDVARGFGVAWLATRWLGAAGAPAAVLGLLIGNHWPLFHGFRGGKGVATYIGVTLAVQPLAVALGLAAWIAAYKLGRKAFIGSFAMVVVFTGGNLLAGAAKLHFGYVAVLAFLLFTHRENLRTHFRRDTARPASRAEVFGVVCFAAALVAFTCEPLWALGPLALFVAVMVATPFLPALSFFLPVVTRGETTAGGAALTFDDGPHPETTPLLLELLKRHDAIATFFVVGRQAERHPELIEQILAAGHSLGNHSYAHDVGLMLRGSAAIRRDIAAGQEVLGRHGAKPLIFRPPVGITAPPLGPILREMGLTCVGFNRRALDWGNRRISGFGARLGRRVSAGDIVLLHDKPPSNATVEDWLAEVETLLGRQRERNVAVVPLAALLPNSK